MRLLLFCLACGLSMAMCGTAAQASLIVSGPQTYAGGPVNLGGLEWLGWNDPETQNLSVSTVTAKLSPGGSLDGWRYATRSEFEALFDSLYGGVQGAHVDNYDGNLWLYEEFQEGLPSSKTLDIAYGLDAAPSGTALRGLFNINTSVLTGYFDDDLGLSGGDPSSQLTFLTSSTEFEGHALVRSPSSTSSVSTPEPGSLVVMGIGMLGMVAGGRRRRRRAKLAG